MRFAQVMVDVNHTHVDKLFEYIIPPEMDEQIQIGHRVLLPFGNRRQAMEGFVINMVQEPLYDPAQMKSIQSLLDEYPVFLPDQIELAKWMAKRYYSTLVGTLRLMIPAQLRGGRIHKRMMDTIELALDEAEREKAESSLYGKTGTCKAPKQREILQILSDLGVVTMHDLEKRIHGARSAVYAMQKKGWVLIQSQEDYRQPYQMISEKSETPPVLTEQQKAVVGQVIDSIQNGQQAYILRGVTGSGKTEVYLRCIAACMEQGKTAIVLVPEISLTPQTVERFRARFGERIAVLHSRLSAGERYDEWRRIRLGDVQVVVGARSAVFAPLSSLGLIVIDEEHETSYQSDKTPRYHAIEVAQKRCEQQQAILLLGSATPSLETWYRAKQGELHILTLAERVNGQPLPAVEIVDMREELERGNRSMFSTALYQQMRSCYFQQKQMILFLNRRGYSTFVSCRGCGEVLMCRHCDVSMTFHKIDGTVRCHYCDAVQPIPDICPSCKKPYLKHFGVGTEQVEEQVLRFFPGIRTIRMDYDTTQRKNAHVDLLQAFRKHEADVLIGTQMITKGLDFPNVTLVGVIAADATLFIPDYRSAERAFQLITQVAGRAGRDRDAGHVIVQTYSPSHPSIQHSAHHDFEAFYAYEIKSRKQSEFPPFADFVRFLFVSETDAEAAEKSKEFREKLLSEIEGFMAREGIDRSMLLYVSAHAAPLHVLRNHYRHQVVLKILRNADTRCVMDRIALFAKEMNGGIMPNMEINPQSML